MARRAILRATAVSCVASPRRVRRPSRVRRAVLTPASAPLHARRVPEVRCAEPHVCSGEGRFRFWLVRGNLPFGITASDPGAVGSLGRRGGSPWDGVGTHAPPVGGMSEGGAGHDDGSSAGSEGYEPGRGPGRPVGRGLALDRGGAPSRARGRARALEAVLRPAGGAGGGHAPSTSTRATRSSR